MITVMDEHSLTSMDHGRFLGTLTTESLCAFDDVRTEAGRTVARYDHESAPLSVAVPTLIAQCAGIDPVSLPPMYDCVEVDALEALLGNQRTDQSDTRVAFDYAGYAVTASKGRLTVQPVE